MLAFAQDSSFVIQDRRTLYGLVWHFFKSLSYHGARQRCFAHLFRGCYMRKISQQPLRLKGLCSLVLAGLIFFSVHDVARSHFVAVCTSMPAPETDAVSQEERNPPSEQQRDMERKRELALKKQEYEKTKKMSQDLFTASEELKDLIEKAGENTLPLQAIKKLEEIESLSRKIKSRLTAGT